MNEAVDRHRRSTNPTTSPIAGTRENSIRVACDSPSKTNLVQTHAIGRLRSKGENGGGCSVKWRSACALFNELPGLAIRRRDASARGLILCRSSLVFSIHSLFTCKEDLKAELGSQRSTTELHPRERDAEMPLSGNRLRRMTNLPVLAMP